MCAGVVGTGWESDSNQGAGPASLLTPPLDSNGSDWDSSDESDPSSDTGTGNFTRKLFTTFLSVCSLRTAIIYGGEPCMVREHVRGVRVKHRIRKLFHLELHLLQKENGATE